MMQSQYQQVTSEQPTSKLAALLEARDIKYLLHFTPVANLQSILQHGLMGRAELLKRQLPFYITDRKRLDGNPNAICLSVSWPNYRMFYSKRCENERNGYDETQWVVLALDPQLLLSHSAAFTPTNAANHHCRGPWEHKTGAEAFEAMFDNAPLRQQQGLAKNQPTDPQAEVQVSSHISPDWISEIGCHPQADLSMVQALAGDYRVTPCSWLFERRRDWRIWQKYA